MWEINGITTEIINDLLEYNFIKWEDCETIHNLITTTLNLYLKNEEGKEKEIEK